MSDFTETASFIKENMNLNSEKDGKMIFQVTKAPYQKYMASKGITKAAFAQYNEAEAEYINGVAVVAKDELLGNKDAKVISIRTRTPNGREDCTLEREREFTNPATKEKIKRYGYLTISSKRKKIFDADLVASIQDEIEKAM